MKSSTNERGFSFVAPNSKDGDELLLLPLSYSSTTLPPIKCPTTAWKAVRRIAPKKSSQVIIDDGEGGDVVDDNDAVEDDDEK